METLLLVEDSTDTQLVIKNIFESEFQLKIVGSIKDAQEEIDQRNYSLVIMDVNLPDGDGLEFYSNSLEKKGDNLPPFFFLTARTNIQDKVLGLSLGAEDYIVKPFDPLELKVRIIGRMKKIQTQQMQNMVLTKGNLKIDTSTQEAKLLTDDKELLIDLTPKEFKLLLFFFKHENQVLSRKQILEHVWSEVNSLTDRTVDVHICKLRKKIAQGKHAILPVHGTGYRFTPNR